MEQEQSNMCNLEDLCRMMSQSVENNNVITHCQVHDRLMKTAR